MSLLNVFVRVFVFLLAVSNGACKQQSAAHPINREITFAISQAPLNLDPRYATDAASERLNRLIYRSLVDFDQQSKPLPSLATWVEVNPKQFRFTLYRNREKFHNNGLLNARDVKATYDSLVYLKDSPHAAEFVNIKSIKVLDDDTLVFELKNADAHLPSKLIIGILPEDLIRKNYDFSHFPIGSGALKFISWNNNRLLMQRVGDGQKISLLEVKDPTVRVLKLLNKEVDLLQGELPAELVQYLRINPEFKVKSSIGTNFSYIGINMQDSTLKSLKIRQALLYAINRQQIIDKVMVSDTRIAEVILPPEHYAGNPALVSFEYNPALSKQLLMEAGIILPLKLVYKTSNDAQRMRLATIMQAQLKTAGIELEIRSLDWGTFFEDVKQGQFQLYGLTWVGIKTPEIYSKAFHSDYFPPNGFNRGHFKDPELDKLLIKEDWAAATTRIQSQLPYIPLWYEGQFAVMNQDINNYSPKPDGNWDDLATIRNHAH